VWGWPLLVLLVGTHLYLTVRLRFIQRYLGTAIRLSFSRTAEGEGDVSHFGALTTALAATIGTGNIVGRRDGGSRRRAGRRPLDVADGRLRHRNQVRRGRARHQVPHHDAAGHDGGRADVRARARPPHALARRRVRHPHRDRAFGIGNMVQANSISAMVVETSA